MLNAIIRPRFKARYRLPDDPCRVLGGKRIDPQQSRPMQLFNQVAMSQFNTTIRQLGGGRVWSYKARKLKDFKSGYLSSPSYKPSPIFIPRG